jgi:hypothetical protein
MTTTTTSTHRGVSFVLRRKKSARTPSSSSFASQQQKKLQRRRRRTPTRTTVKCQSKELETALIREQTIVQDLVRWCIENGFSGSGLGVRPSTSGKGRGLEATRLVEKDECVLTLPLRSGIVDEAKGHPEHTREVIEKAPWGVRLACRLLQERKKGAESAYAAYLELIPENVETSPLHYASEEVSRICYPPMEKEIEEMRKAVKKWYDDLNAGEGKEALAGASEEEFKCAVAVVHSRTYGVSSGDTGEGYFRALLPLADLLNHGGDEYIDETRSSTSTVSTETVAWSEITDEEDESEIAFTAQKTLEPGEEALMSYGERSNDHFLLYYGFVPRKNPHDDVIIFENFDSAMMWHAMCFDEFWRREDIAIREQNAVRAYKETSKMLRETSDGALIDAEPRLKVLSDGRVDARVLAAFAALYAGDSELANNQETDRESLNAARKDVALRCQQLIQTVQKQSGKGEAEEMFSEDSSNKSRNKNNNNNNNSNNTNTNNRNDIENVVDAFRRHKMFILRDCVRKLSVAL